ncbi:DUF397 domain-containing protein [Streptomyces sp. NBC_00523]|uniref:DUF397 domain-containing protein n=1 Tax=Streptomyces sp. NBC_00523 TaxID=2975765 RepID=UPI002E807285|nr:DUF397 domain-containing protein [Streptomyces sp. NBC_00523]WUD00468.1 DUF397 domain-containing protein [Streptomyces sp. NBC_00523]
MIDKPSGGEAAWFRSSYSSSGDGNDCVEVAAARDAVLVRDSKNTQGPVLAFEERAWADFTSHTAKG